MNRNDGRNSSELRPVRIESDVQRFPEGSLLYHCGGTSVLLSVSIADEVPSWLAGEKRGWLTAEYAMHPRANLQRKAREGRSRSGIDGRSSEIQRLIGRALRASVDLAQLQGKTVTIDCDVLNADGGTRTAAISGGFVALALAFGRMRKKGILAAPIFREQVAAVSVGILNGETLVDLSYIEDKDALVDLNVVGTVDGRLIEVQGTAEHGAFSRAELDAMLGSALNSIKILGEIQLSALRAAEISLDALMMR